MKIRNLRWGYDGGGVACGPVSGNSLVEVCITGNDKHTYFVIVSQMDGFERTSWIPETHNYGIGYLPISGVAISGVTPRSR